MTSPADALAPPDSEVLEAVAASPARGPVTLSVIEGGCTGIPTDAVTHAIGRLVDRGWLRRLRRRLQGRPEEESLYEVTSEGEEALRRSGPGDEE